MNRIIETPTATDWYDRSLDNLVRVENHEAGVLIRSARHDVPVAAREALIRYLAAEGFIAGPYRWCPRAWPHESDSVAWVTDSDWITLAHRRRRWTARLWAYLSWGRLAAIGLFLLASLVSLWLKHHWVPVL